MDSPSNFAKNYIAQLIELLNKIDCKKIERIIQTFEVTHLNGGTIYFIGNGGSASTASHFANDFSAGLNFKAKSLVDNNAILTAVANDYGYDQVFVKQLRNCLTQNDLLVILSASGNSMNCIKATEWANEIGATSIGLLGFDGGKLANLCTISLVISTKVGEYGPVEDIHLVLDHLISSYFSKRNFQEIMPEPSQVTRCSDSSNNFNTLTSLV